MKRAVTDFKNIKEDEEFSKLFRWKCGDDEGGYGMAPECHGGGLVVMAAMTT